MHAAGVAFYQRDRSLVRVCRIKAKTFDGKTIRVPGIMPVTPAMLCRALGQSAYWEKINGQGKLVRIDPPKEIVEQILGMIDNWPSPPLAGVITCPTLRPDGSLLANEGMTPRLVWCSTKPSPFRRSQNTRRARTPTPQSST